MTTLSLIEVAKESLSILCMSPSFAPCIYGSCCHCRFCKDESYVSETFKCSYETSTRTSRETYYSCGWFYWLRCERTVYSWVLWGLSLCSWGWAWGYNMYRRENACSLGSQTSKMHATGIIFYYFIIICGLALFVSLVYIILIIMMCLYTCHTPRITTNTLFTWSH